MIGPLHLYTCLDGSRLQCSGLDSYLLLLLRGIANNFPRGFTGHPLITPDIAVSHMFNKQCRFWQHFIIGPVIKGAIPL